MSFLNSLPLSSQAATASGIAADILPGAFLPGATGGFPSPSQVSSIARSLLGGGTPLSFSGLSLGPNFIARLVTGLIGLLLIAAAIFTHPTVIEVGKKVGKAAAAAGVAAA